MFILITIIDDGDNYTFIIELYNDYNTYLYKKAFEILLNKSAAEDAVQEAFYKISKHSEKINKLGHTERIAYAVRIVKNVSIDIYNNNKGTVSYDSLDSAEDYLIKNSDTPEIDISQSIENEELKEHINSFLSKEEAYLLDLRYDMDFSFSQIGNMLDISEEAAQKRHYRIINKLKKKLGGSSI